MTLRIVLPLAAAVLATAAAMGAVALWMSQDSAVPASTTVASGDPIRGTALMRLGGCFACHAKKGSSTLSGGAPIETDFGVFHPPNLTPHETDGLGRWDERDFIRAMTVGEGPDGRPYYPVFPYPFYARLDDRDLGDIWSALRAVPAVAGTTPEHRLSFPYGMRQGLFFWKLLYLDASPLAPAPDRSPVWRRGRYIVETLGHCGSCHTPRGLLGGRKASWKFTGGAGAEGEKAPPISAAALAAAGWSIDDLAFALDVGLDLDGDSFGGGMAAFVRANSSHWSDEDRRAAAFYLMNP